MVAADIDTNSSAVSSSMTSSPKCRNTATSSSNIGASRHPQYQPASRQCSDHIRPVDGGTRTSPRRHHLRPQRRLERLTGMVTVPTGVGAQLVQNPALDSPI